MLKKSSETSKQQNDEIFQLPPKKFELPVLWQSRLEEVYDEIELLGWPVTYTWFDLLETPFRGEIMAGDMSRFVGKKIRMLGLLVTIKYVRTVRKGMDAFRHFHRCNRSVFRYRSLSKSSQ